MSKISEILETITIPSSGLNLKKIDGLFLGKSSNSDIVFGIETQNKNLISLTQSTKYLSFYLNSVFEVTFSGAVSQMHLSLIILKSFGEKYTDVFLRLANSFSSVPTDQELLQYFLSLKSLFSSDSKTSIIELQGLFGELYSMIYLRENGGIDMSQYYQSEDKRKFDFSVSDRKKIEIKTTTLPTRIHRFKLDQLNTLRYDIIIVSILLQKDDCGMSLLELISKARNLFASNLYLLLRIESMIKNVSDEVLNALKYNVSFAKDRIKFYDAKNIPHIDEKTPNGVFNIEFDSDLSTSRDITVEEFLVWINSKDDKYKR